MISKLSGRVRSLSKRSSRRSFRSLRSKKSSSDLISSFDEEARIASLKNIHLSESSETSLTSLLASQPSSPEASREAFRNSQQERSRRKQLATARLSSMVMDEPPSTSLFSSFMASRAWRSLRALFISLVLLIVILALGHGVSIMNKAAMEIGIMIFIFMNFAFAGLSKAKKLEV